VKKFVFIAMLLSCCLAGSGQPDPDLETNAATATVQATPPAADKPVTRDYPRITHIDSDSADFDLNARGAVYRGHVRVTEEDMKLTCMWLTANLPQSGRMSEIIAETNVVIDFKDPKGDAMHATADKAIYHYIVENGVTNETVTLTGNASVEKPEGTLSGEPIVWDRANNRLTATNQKMIYRPGAITETNAPAATNAPEIHTNPPAEPDTNAPVGVIDRLTTKKAS